jgi:hypothetical protein
MEGYNVMDITKKNLVLISYLQSLFDDYIVKAEYSTNDNDKKVITVQEQPGQKVVFFGDISPLFNYYQINIYGMSIRENKNMATTLGELIGQMRIIDYDNEKWQIIFKQYSNPQAIEYIDIRRVGYSMIFQCIVNKISD